MEAEHDDPTYISPIEELSFVVEIFAQTLRIGALSVTDDLASIPFLTRTFQQKCDEIFEAAKGVLHVRDIAVDAYQVVFELREACQSLNPESWLIDPETYDMYASQNAENLKRFSTTIPDKLANLAFRLKAFSYVNRWSAGDQESLERVEDKLSSNQGKVYRVLKGWDYPKGRATLERITEAVGLSRGPTHKALKELMDDLRLVFNDTLRGYQLKK